MVLYSNNSTLWWYYSFTVACGEIPISGPTHGRNPYHEWVHGAATNKPAAAVTPRQSKQASYIFFSSAQ